MEQRKLFESIFSDASLVDIDMSVWDKYIAIYVMAGHLRRAGTSTLPLFVVEFARVHSMEFTFNHVSYEPPLDLGPDQHVQWPIYLFDIRQADGKLEIMLSGNLSGSSATPEMRIVCEDVNIWEMAQEPIDRLFPRWSKPYTGLIRPGLDVLSGYDFADRLQAREYADRRLLGKDKNRR